YNGSTRRSLLRQGGTPLPYLFGANAPRPSSVICSLLLLSLPNGCPTCCRLHLVVFAHTAWELSVKEINNLLFSSSHPDIHFKSNRAHYPQVNIYINMRNTCSQ